MSVLFRKFFCLPGVWACLLVACQQVSQQESPVQDSLPPQEAEKVALPKSGVRSDVPVISSVPETKPELVPPAIPADFVPAKPGRRVARVNVPGPYVALTFDDGPSPANTPKILDILREHGAHATFFVAGENAVNNKKILARAAAEGHEIASHTYSHIKLTSSSNEKIDREMTRTGAIIEEAIGRQPSLMRPPYGATNARIVDKMYNDYGLTSVLWDVDTRDWQHPGVGTVIQRAVGNARSGSIILVHDIHASTLAAVEGIVTGLQARGFKLVTVSQLIALGAGAATEPSLPETPLPEENKADAVPSLPVPEAADSERTPGSASISVNSSETEEAL